jgi:hypothetical protein
MSIRIVVTDRSTGEPFTITPPAPTEFVKDGKRHVKAPKVDDLVAVLKHRSRLGLTGGPLAA